MGTTVVPHLNTNMRAIFALVVLVGCSNARPQELGAAPVIVVDAAAAATNVEAAPAAVSAVEQDVNRQGIAAGIVATGGAPAVIIASAGGAGGAAAGAGGAGAGAGAGTGAGAGAVAGPCRNPSPYGCAFFGPGINNPMAIAPLAQSIKTAQGIAVQNPNLRVLVNADGTLIFTNQYGQEQEVVDQFGLEPFEPIDPVEHQELFAVQAQTEAQRLVTQYAATVYRDLGLSPDGMTLLPAAGPGLGAAGAAGAGTGANALNNFNINRRFSLVVAK